MTTTNRSQVRQLLTEDIDTQIAELRQRKSKLAAAGQALVAAADEIDHRKAAVEEAKALFAQRRQEIIDLGVKPREVTRMLDELRAAIDTTSSAPAQTPTPDAHTGQSTTEGSPADTALDPTAADVETMSAAE